jgi:hypothetical protein
MEHSSAFAANVLKLDGRDKEKIVGGKCGVDSIPGSAGFITSRTSSTKFSKANRVS